MVEWNRIFRLFRFSGILGQPREILPKFRNEIPENVCSIRSPTRNFRNFWSNGKRPKCATFLCPFTSLEGKCHVFPRDKLTCFFSPLKPFCDEGLTEKYHTVHSFIPLLG